MAYDRLLLPRGITLKSGKIHSDGWCSPRFEIHADAAPDARCLGISLLNPDFSPVFLDNDVSVDFNDNARRIGGIQPDQQVDMLLHVDAGEGLRARVAIGKAVPPSAFDARERSMKLMSIAWVEARSEGE